MAKAVAQPAQMPQTAMNVPAHIAKRIAERKDTGVESDLISAIVGGEGFPYPRISIRAGRFRLVEKGVETVVGYDMKVIIVGANPNVSKVFYGRPYDPEAQDMRPDCFSNDGQKPDPSVVDPVHSTCATCPNNVLGSRITPSGAKSKLCADQRHLAVVPAADPTKIYALTVPVSGMKSLREYFKHLQNYGLAPNEVVTKLSFDDNASYPKLVFSQDGFVSEDGLKKVDVLMQDETIKEITRQVPIGTYNKALAELPEDTQSADSALPAPRTPSAAEVDEAYEEDVVEEAPSDLDQALAKIFS